MAAVVRSLIVQIGSEDVWAVVRCFDDPGALAPGFVTNVTLDKGDRIVEFADGGNVREMLVSRDESIRRIAYTAVGGRLQHHHAVMEVVPIHETCTRIDWLTDVLPDQFAPFVAARMDAGVASIARAFKPRSTDQGSEPEASATVRRTDPVVTDHLPAATG